MSPEERKAWDKGLAEGQARTLRSLAGRRDKGLALEKQMNDKQKMRENEAFNQAFCAVLNGMAQSPNFTDAKLFSRHVGLADMAARAAMKYLKV